MAKTKTYNVLVDTMESTQNNAFTVNTNDLKSVKLNLLINQDGEPLDLTDATVRLAVKKPDQKSVLQDATILDAVAGSCEIILDTQAYVIPGNYTAEVMVFYGTDTVAVTSNFAYKANRGIMNDDSVESTNEWQSITQAIADNEALLADLRDNGTGVDAQARADISTVTTQLASKMTKVKGWYYFDSDFGGKANDATFDNTPKLLSALNTMNTNGGGRLIFGGAKYTFLTPLTVTSQLKGITLEGSNFSVDTNGTSFDYKGTGMFLTFSGGLHTTFLKNISILCNYNTYGIRIDTTCTRSGMLDCAIYNTLGGILLNAAAYGIFENVAVYPRGLNSLGTHSEYGLKIGENPAAILEHTYFNRCTFDGGTAFESYCDLVVILGEAGGFHFFECDFANTINDTGATNGRAFNITSANSKITDIYVTNCNFSRCAGGIYLNAQTYSLQNIVFNNVRFSFRETVNTEQGFYVTRGGSNVANLIVKGLDVVTNGGSVKPQYILYGEDNALDTQSSFELSRCEYTTVGQGLLRAGNNFTRVKVEDCRIRKSMRVSYTGDGTTTLYQITLSNQSPYTHLPFIAVGSNLAQTFKYAVANTNGGVLRLDVTFASAPPNAQTFFIYYNILGGNLEGSGIF